jgi:serine/threonine protein kinase
VVAGGQAVAELRQIPFASLEFPKEVGLTGVGSFGIVRQAWWKDGHLTVAVKANSTKCADIEAIQNEKRLLDSLLRAPHANIVSVYGVCTDAPDGNLLIVMKLCNGGSLDSFLKKSHPVRASACACGASIAAS